MKLPRHLASVALVFVLTVGIHDSLNAQVVETRESESNPVVTIFKGTMYGAGTGLLLGGAYALIESDSQDETWDILKWGAAGGAIAGAAVGLVYAVLRPQPRGDADVVGMVDASDGQVRFGAPTLLTRRVDTPGASSLAFEARLLQARF